MSLPRETLLELMALADGELEGEAKERADSLAAQNPEARRVVDAMRAQGVRTWLSEAVEQRVRSADGIADAVMAKLDPSAQLGEVRRLSGAPSRVRPRIALAGAVLGSALALAAAVAMYVGSTRGRTPVASIPGSRGSGTAPDLEPSATTVGGPEGAAAGRGVEVEEIDSTSRVSIFEIAAVANASTRSSVVVWIDDEPGEK
jgi:anti-sigma factor RsiW